ncbi:microtubule-actin cross-linking factor 1, isoforms 6/7-like [Paramormyrops kingsleyae]|uniref:microtubule-actin cross-linking factor 1, isoforms 6/7-like n=1 Tax=Paramormyrops kingsleyae TaxID=1676925 RepID=UPI003B976D9E
MGKPLSRPDCLRRGHHSSRCLGKGQGEDGAIEDCYIPQRSIYDTVRINEQIDQGSVSSTLASGGGEGSTLSTEGTLGAVGASRPGSGRKLDERQIYDALKLSAEPLSLSTGEGGASVSPGASSCSSALGGARRSIGFERNEQSRRSWKTFLPAEFMEEATEKQVLGSPPARCTASPTDSPPTLISFSERGETPPLNPAASCLPSQTLNTTPASDLRPVSVSPSRQTFPSVRLGSAPLPQPLFTCRALKRDAEAEGDALASELDGDKVPLLPPLVPLTPTLCPSSTERTWPRRLMGRRRTVSQGGVLHNLPILPPLPPLLAEHSGVDEVVCLLGPASVFPQGRPSVAGELRLGDREWGGLQQLEEEEEDEGSEGRQETDEYTWEALLRQVDSLWEPMAGGADMAGWDPLHMGSLGRWPLLRPPAGFGGSEPPSGPGSELGSDDLELEGLGEEAKEGVGLTSPTFPMVGRASSRPGTLPGARPSLELLEQHSPNEQGQDRTAARELEVCTRDNLGGLDALSDGGRPDCSTDTINTTSEEALPGSRVVREGVTMETQDAGNTESLQMGASEGQEEACSEGGEEKEAIRLQEVSVDLQNGKVDCSRRSRDLPLPLSPSKQELGGPTLEGKADAFVTTDSFVYLAVSALTPFPQDTKPPSLDGSEPPSPGALPQPWPEESDFLSTDSFVYLAAPERLTLAPGQSSACGDSQGSSSEDSRSGVDFVLGSMNGESDWDSDGSGSERAPGLPSWDHWEELEPAVLQELFRDDQWEHGLGPCDCGSSVVEGEGDEQGEVKEVEDGLQPSEQVEEQNPLIKILMSQWRETLAELDPWLEEMESSIAHLLSPACGLEELTQQQDQLRLLRECVSEHQAYISKLLLTGSQLASLGALEEVTMRERSCSAEQRYVAVMEKVRSHGRALVEAICQSSQFHEKIGSLLETLERAALRLRQRPPVAVEVEKIQEQLAVHRAAGWELDKLLPSYSVLCHQGEEMATWGKEAYPETQTVQLQLQRLQSVWDEIRQRADEREAKLLAALDLAQAFWAEAEQLQDTLRDAHVAVKELEAPEIDPVLIKHQMEITESIRAEVDGLWQKLGALRTLGADLIAACGETDKQQVVKTMEEINTAWDRLSRTCGERKERLEEALMTSLQYQHALQNMFDYLDSAMRELNEMSLVVVDLGTVMQQMEELKLYRAGVYQQQINMEVLTNQQAALLKRTTDLAEKNKIQEPLTVLRELWDHLGTKITQRQHQLQGALLALGQFEYILSELQSWLCQTHISLDTLQAVSCDPRTIEMELAQHRVLKNELLSRNSMMENISGAGWELMESSSGERASHLQGQLETLNHSWQSLLLEVQAQQKILEAALLKAERYQRELEESIQWLSDTEKQLADAVPTGGLPETGREQLQRHLALQEELLQRMDQFHRLLEQRQTMLPPHGEEGEGGLSIGQTLQKLTLLQNKWSTLNTRMEEKKLRLEQMVTLATAFQASLQVCINWLIQAEQALNMAPPPSLILDTVLLQMAQHQEFMTGLNSHRNLVLVLETDGSHLSSMSLEQDVVLIRSLLLRVHARWDQLVQSSLDRDQHLEKARLTAEKFKEAWLEFWEWLQEAESRLDADLEISNDPGLINRLLIDHKEFQKFLHSKRPVFYTTVRFCRTIREQATLPADTLKLGNLLGKIRDKWDYVCGRTVDRQQQLDQALLEVGQVDVALQGILDWLLQVEPQLDEQDPVHGDLGLVAHLVDSHKVLQQELGKRAGSFEALKRSATEVMERSGLCEQLQDVSQRWDRVCGLSVTRQLRLQQALKQAEEFHSWVQRLRAWLSGLEQGLHYRGLLPEEEPPLQALLQSQKELMQAMQGKRQDVDRVVSLGEAILRVCHPDGFTSIKLGVASLQERFQEVLTWVKQHEQRLERALEELQKGTIQLQDLQSWLQWAESRLAQREAAPLPQQPMQLRALISEHYAFMEEVKHKQEDVDQMPKNYRKKTSGNNFGERLRMCEKCCCQWQKVWQSSLLYQRKLSDALYRLEELKEAPAFDFETWRQRYMLWLHLRKDSLMEVFRNIDRDQDGRIRRLEFTEGILDTNFPTSQQELVAVADIFDRDGYIDYYQFVAALLSSRDHWHFSSDRGSMENEMFRQVVQCRCAKRFQVEALGGDKYKFWDSECSVRRLFGLVLVRLGNVYMALDQFLLKYDPCRASGPTGCSRRKLSRKRGADV